MVCAPVVVNARLHEVAGSVMVQPVEFVAVTEIVPPGVPLAGAVTASVAFTVTACPETVGSVGSSIESVVAALATVSPIFVLPLRACASVIDTGRLLAPVVVPAGTVARNE